VLLSLSFVADGAKTHNVKLNNNNPIQKLEMHDTGAAFQTMFLVVVVGDGRQQQKQKELHPNPNEGPGQLLASS
jgi:hypothetical protein